MIDISQGAVLCLPVVRHRVCVPAAGWARGEPAYFLRS